MYQRILVPVDGSPTSNTGLAEAIKLTGAQVRVLHVVDEMPFLMSADSFAAMPGDVFTILKEAGRAVLEQAQMTIQAAGIPVEAPASSSLTYLPSAAAPTNISTRSRHRGEQCSRLSSAPASPLPTCCAAQSAFAR